jgi:hypothetical protein
VIDERHLGQRIQPKYLTDSGMFRFSERFSDGRQVSLTDELYYDENHVNPISV